MRRFINHTSVSLVKSLMRISACGYLYMGSLEGAALMLFAAEILGIGEELV